MLFSLSLSLCSSFPLRLRLSFCIALFAYVLPPLCLLSLCVQGDAAERKKRKHLDSPFLSLPRSPSSRLPRHSSFPAFPCACPLLCRHLVSLRLLPLDAQLRRRAQTTPSPSLLLPHAPFSPWSLLHPPPLQAMCDIGDGASCSRVLTSEWSRGFGLSSLSLISLSLTPHSLFLRRRRHCPSLPGPTQPHALRSSWLRKCRLTRPFIPRSPPGIVEPFLGADSPFNVPNAFLGLLYYTLILVAADVEALRWPLFAVSSRCMALQATLSPLGSLRRLTRLSPFPTLHGPTCTAGVACGRRHEHVPRYASTASTFSNANFSAPPLLTPLLPYAPPPQRTFSRSSSTTCASSACPRTSSTARWCRPCGRRLPSRRPCSPAVKRTTSRSFTRQLEHTSKVRSENKKKDSTMEIRLVWMNGLGGPNARLIGGPCGRQPCRPSWT